MKNVKLVVGTSILAGALLLGNSVANASIDKEKLTNDAVNTVTEKFDYNEDGISPAGEIEDKGNYYEIPIIQATGVGGLKIIKIDKENGAIQYGDNDTQDFESAGSIELDNYDS